MNRFVKEYANSKIKLLKENELMQQVYKDEKINRIKRATELFYQYLLTVDETMRIISEA